MGRKKQANKQTNYPKKRQSNNNWVIENSQELAIRDHHRDDSRLQEPLELEMQSHRREKEEGFWRWVLVLIHYNLLIKLIS
jgi:hypothetical protein